MEKIGVICLIVLAIGFIILLAFSVLNKNKTKGLPHYANPPAPPIKKPLRKFILSGKVHRDFLFWYWNLNENINSEECKIFHDLSVTCQNARITDWFREVHNLHSYVERYDDGSFDYVITSDLFTEVVDYGDGPFETFLEAQNKSIKIMESKIYVNDFPNFPTSEPSPPKCPKDRIG